MGHTRADLKLTLSTSELWVYIHVVQERFCKRLLYGRHATMGFMLEELIFSW